MKRSLALGLGAAAVLAVAGCSQNGSYRLSWNFQADGVTVSSAVGCGRYYVDSILVTGNDATGDAQQVRALCTPGSVTSTAPDGTWSFQLQMLDAEGVLIPSSMMLMQTKSAEPIASGTPQVQFPVIPLEPLSAGDGGGDGGIDGGGDGGIDGGGDGGIDGGIDGGGDGGVDAADSGHDGDSGGTHD